ncbi:hypothetical protein CYMTET_28185 [Cymbomonas tetramitiformis]|uniref:Uncharacterized protein n=1 Tax=Cymbomonas tetramitiformis TaxID=36881 RepID=A0AAE0FNB5_9CHLO|nr:hypothetical protein CYMTET_28185 [Cymbomonas tetramitiformis]
MAPLRKWTAHYLNNTGKSDSYKGTPRNADNEDMPSSVRQGRRELTVDALLRNFDESKNSQFPKNFSLPGFARMCYTPPPRPETRSSEMQSMKKHKDAQRTKPKSKSASNSRSSAPRLTYEEHLRQVLQEQAMQGKFADQLQQEAIAQSPVEQVFEYLPLEGWLALDAVPRPSTCPGPEFFNSSKAIQRYAAKGLESDGVASSMGK